MIPSNHRSQYFTDITHQPQRLIDNSRIKLEWIGGNWGFTYHRGRLMQGNTWRPRNIITDPGNVFSHRLFTPLLLLYSLSRRDSLPSSTNPSQEEESCSLLNTQEYDVRMQGDERVIAPWRKANAVKRPLCNVAPTSCKRFIHRIVSNA